MGFLKNMKISAKLFLMVLIFTSAFAALIGYSYVIMERVKVNGEIYNQVVQNKDLVADILPPTEYVIESYLVVLQMVNETDPAKITQLKGKFNQLKNEYEVRHNYWNVELRNKEIKDELLDTSYKYAKNFYNEAEGELFPYIEKGDKENAIKILNEKIDKDYKLHRESIERVVKLANAKTILDEGNAKTVIFNGIAGLLIIGAAVVLLTALFVFKIGEMIIRPIKNVSNMSLHLADGDLTQKIETENRDEIGEMGKNLNNFLETLTEIITEINSYSGRVASGTEEMSATMNQISASTDNLKESSSTTAAAIEELSSTTTTVFQNVETLLTNSEQTLRLANNGGDVVKVTISGISKIKRVVEEGTKNVSELGNKTNEIGEIVNVINDIAAQTNLLALNAAIEAARAGEAGKGFEVVAEEVRKLAEKTTVSTKEIAKMVKEIQSDTKAVIVKMTEVNEEVDEGVKTANNTGAALEEIVAQTENLRNMINMIATSTREQSLAAEEIAKQTENVTISIEENGRAIGQSTDAIKEIAVVAEKLNQIVNQFKIENSKNRGLKGRKDSFH